MNASYTKSQRLLEYSAIATFSVLAFWSIWRLVDAAQWDIVPVILIAAPMGWLSIDLLSGVLHWLFDSWGSVKTPFIGNAFIRPFREHHVEPEAMTRHDVVETNGSSCLAALPFLAVTSQMQLTDFVTFLAHAFLLSLALGALATNQCHKWAHMDEASTPRIISWAQRQHLVLPRSHHQRHHTAPFNSHFCMASGWLNPLFNAILRKWR